MLCTEWIFKKEQWQCSVQLPEIDRDSNIEKSCVESPNNNACMCIYLPHKPGIWAFIQFTWQPFFTCKWSKLLSLYHKDGDYLSNTIIHIIDSMTFFRKILDDPRWMINDNYLMTVTWVCSLLWLFFISRSDKTSRGRGHGVLRSCSSLHFIASSWTHEPVRPQWHHTPSGKNTIESWM